MAGETAAHPAEVLHLRMGRHTLRAVPDRAFGLGLQLGLLRASAASCCWPMPTTSEPSQHPALERQTASRIFQQLDGKSGRAFCFFEAEGEAWLAFANLHHDTLLYRWADGRFVVAPDRSAAPVAASSGGSKPTQGGRLVQVNFLHGTREAADPATAVLHLSLRRRPAGDRRRSSRPAAAPMSRAFVGRWPGLPGRGQQPERRGALSHAEQGVPPRRRSRERSMSDARQPKESPELVRLFETYTAGPDSIGAKLTALTAEATANDPLIVATGTDFVLFPGGGRDPEIEGFRMSDARLQGAGRDLAPRAGGGLAAQDARARSGGRAVAAARAQRLLDSHARGTRRRTRSRCGATSSPSPPTAAASRPSPSWSNYSCELTERYLERALAAPETFTADRPARRTTSKAAAGAVGATVPMNAVMIATFFLVGMDIGHRVIAWFDRHDIDWSRAMALIVGRQGRPTAGVTWTTNSVCAMILGASRHKLALDRLYIAPHGPASRSAQLPDLAAVARLRSAVAPALVAHAHRERTRPADVRGLPALRADDRQRVPRWRPTRRASARCRRSPAPTTGAR